MIMELCWSSTMLVMDDPESLECFISWGELYLPLLNPSECLPIKSQRSLQMEEPDVHEVVWSSAEQIIQNTKGDVLLIFDCCHAAELEKSNRGFKRRAFEYLAATSAKSTTRKPGPQSFTSALIWSLKHFAKEGKSFSTTDLINTITTKAPNFPENQEPRLSERHGTCLRRIVLAPLTKTGKEKALSTGAGNEEENVIDNENEN